jgi:Icc-related predicted phosphoesterase
MPEWVESGAGVRPGTSELSGQPPPEGERREGGDRRRRTRTRVAAVGDFHVGEEDVGAFRDLFAAANDEADVLVICGDLTRRGLVPEFKSVVGELADVKIPIVAVLGNHDYESGQSVEGTSVLRGRGIHVLAGDTFELNEYVGFAGVKGFMGGFGRGTLTAFGEPEAKAFVGAALDEVQRFELALRRLATPIRVGVLHYSPVSGTVAGEPEIIFPFLGTDRLAEPIDRYGCSLAFHGHAHSGTFRGQTSGGVPVFNVSLPLLRKEGIGKLYYVHEISTANLSAR